MKRALIFLLLFTFAGAHAASLFATSSASPHRIQSNSMYGTHYLQQETYSYRMPEMQTQCIMTGGAKYSSFVYEPFNNAVPSEYTDGQAYTPSVSGKRKLGGGTDPGNQSTQSPVGEPWILAVFALLFAGVMAWKKKSKSNLEGASRQ